MTQHAAPQHQPICIPKPPHAASWRELAKQAKAIRADNVPDGVDIDQIGQSGQSGQSEPAHGGRLALDIKLRWPKTGVKLTVSFLDNPEAELRRKILAHMNMWNKTANVEFVEQQHDIMHADVRILRKADDGYWSWLGIDIRNHPGEPTMNLDSFTLRTPESEFKRVVCHETGHTLGFPHEHLRAELVDRLDREKTIAYFMRTQGWTRSDVIYQVLTPLGKSTILGTATADQVSVMCYDVPGECTKDGKPITGGTHIDVADFEFASRVYPKPASHAG